MRSLRSRKPSQRAVDDIDDEEDELGVDETNEENGEEPSARRTKKRHSSSAQIKKEIVSEHTKKRARATQEQQPPVDDDGLPDWVQPAPPPAPVAPSQFTQRNRIQVKIDPQELSKIKTKVKSYEEEAQRRLEDANIRNISIQELERLAGRVVRHMLFSHYEKPGVPVGRDKLNALFADDFKGDKSARKLPQVVVAMAQAKLMSVFGMEMKEVERVTEKRKGGAAVGAGGGAGVDEAGGAKHYLLLSALPVELRTRHVRGALQGRGPDEALTLLVLALIHLSGGKLEEGGLTAWLAQLGVGAGEEGEGEDHPSLGRIGEALHRLEAARYVLKTKKAAGGGGGGEGGEEGAVYEWAEAAHAEVGEAGIKRFIDQEFSKYESKRARQQAREAAGLGDDGEDEEDGA